MPESVPLHRRVMSNTHESGRGFRNGDVLAYQSTGAFFLTGIPASRASNPPLSTAVSATSGGRGWGGVAGGVVGHPYDRQTENGERKVDCAKKLVGAIVPSRERGAAAAAAAAAAARVRGTIP